MENDINLLKVPKKTKVKKSRFFNACVAILVFIIILTAAEFAYKFYLNNKLNSLKTNQNSTMAKIVEINNKRVNFQTLKERLESLGNILSEAKLFEKKITFIVNNMPSGITLTSLSSSQNTISVGVESSNLASLNSFLDKGLTNISKSPELQTKKTTIESVGVSPSGGYTAQILFTF